MLMRVNNLLIVIKKLVKMNLLQMFLNRNLNPISSKTFKPFCTFIILEISKTI